MSEADTFDALVKQHYPNAVTQTEFRQRVQAVLPEHPFPQDKVLLVTSVCADDIVAENESKQDANERCPTSSIRKGLENDFLGPFSMGGLAGLPYSGLTGMKTVGSHIPDEGSVLIAYGPHIGFSDEGVLGDLRRPGKRDMSHACGALLQAVEHFESSPDYQPADNDDDVEQMTLERRLLPYRPRILGAEKGPPRLKEATGCAYNIIHGLIDRYLYIQKAAFSKCEYVVLVGGIIINTSPCHEDYIDVRHLRVCRPDEL